MLNKPRLHELIYIAISLKDLAHKGAIKSDEISRILLQSRANC